MVQARMCFDFICQPKGSISKICLMSLAADCGSLANPPNGEVKMSGTTFNSTITFSCNDGYHLVGETTRTCQANGSWSGNESTCT